jgi:dephospho-CoA kinase
MADEARPRPLRVALTGGIATGKSYCLPKFAALGAATIDADVLAHQAVAPGTAGFDAVRSRFGESVVSAQGGLDHKAMARIIFADPDSRRALEAIVHPAVYAAIDRWQRSLDQAGQGRIGIADIPLLYETGREVDFDVVIVTTCDRDQQIARLMARSGLPRDEALRRIGAQMPVEEKTRKATYVIDTSGSFAQTDEQVKQVWDELGNRRTLD